jgi:tRNA threonylcarbamoyl adenosine modification protein YjeE
MRKDATTRHELADREATEALGGVIAARLAPGDVILLEGPLGTGKTTLVRGLVAALGGDPAEVCSPTYVLLESYTVHRGAIRRLHHADLYRLRGHPAAPLDEVGLGEAVEDAAAVTAIEWPEEWPWLAEGTTSTVRVLLEMAGEGRRAQVGWARQS